MQATPLSEHFLVASFPRSGNAWVRILLWHHFGIPVASMFRIDEVPSRFYGIEGVKDVFALNPLGVKTHWPRGKQPDPFACYNRSPALLVVRDVRAASVSNAHHAVDFHHSKKRVQQVLEDMCRHGPMYGTWTEINASYLDSDHPVSLVRYEDLHDDPIGRLQRALQHLLGREVPVIRKDPAPQFSELRSVDPRYFRKGTVDSWRDELPPHLEEILWRNNEPLSLRLGYHRDHIEPCSLAC